MWELFGVRVWHDADMSALDADVLDTFVATAKAVAAERSKK